MSVPCILRSALAGPLALELTLVIFERETVHQDAIERVVETVVDMIAKSVGLESLADDSDCEERRLAGEIPSWLAKHLVAERVVASGCESVDQALIELVGREASSDVQHFHEVAFLSARPDALSGQVDGILEVAGPVLSRPAVEVDAVQLDAHGSDAFELGTQMLVQVLRLDVVSELVAEDGRELFRVFLLDGNPPQNPHLVVAAAHSLNLLQLLHSVCRRVQDSLRVRVLNVLLYLHTVAIHDVLRTHAQLHHLPYLGLTRTIEPNSILLHLNQ